MAPYYEDNFMRKTKIYSILAAFIFLQGICFADAGFTGMAGGSSGFAGRFEQDDVDFTIPFNAFAAVQLNFGSWGIFRANLGLASKNLAEGNLFKGQDATLQMNECSLTLVKSKDNIKNYFGLYLGTYEVVGKDEYLQRHFGIDPVASILTKSATTLAGGVPLYNNEGAGFSYTMHFADAPGTIGCNLYFNTLHDAVLKFNVDLRTAWVTNHFIIDFAGGIGTPIKHDSSAYVLIDTIYLHGGVSMLFGNAHTSSFFIQGGIQNISLTSGNDNIDFDAGKDIFILAEPRINGKKVQVRFTGFSIPEELIHDFLYIDDTLGVALSIYSDMISLKTSNLTLGAHIIGALEGENFMTLLEKDEFTPDNTKINTYVTPFIDLPVANGTLEIMAQIGVCNILNSIYFKGKAKIGYRRAF